MCLPRVLRPWPVSPKACVYSKGSTPFSLGEERGSTLQQQQQYRRLDGQAFAQGRETGRRRQGYTERNELWRGRYLDISSTHASESLSQEAWFGRAAQHRDRQVDAPRKVDACST